MQFILYPRFRFCQQTKTPFCLKSGVVSAGNGYCAVILYSLFLFVKKKKSFDFFGN